MDQESKAPELHAQSEVPHEQSVTELPATSNTNERKEDEEEEEEEEEEDKIVERSYNSRFHKRNKRFPKQVEGVDSAFVAIEPKSGKEVIWNECLLSEKKTEKEQNRYLSIMKKLKRNSHPFLARFLDAWISKPEDGPRKLVFITERLDECSLKQFLCNSPKNNRSWKRHVGQILSVLMFLHRLGITHGNLTKETIYYQNSGNLRVGPFALGGCLDQKSQSSDVYSLGVVALEIAVWTPTDFSQTLSQTELLQEMQARLDNNDQRNFIEMCLDPNPPAGDRVKRLINHPAVTEVPILKLLSAKVIVSSMRSYVLEEGTATEQTGFAALLKEYLSHYEDDAVIVEVHFPHDKIVKSRSWKDFRSNFTLTPKFLDDVKNGFYPLFGCRWAAYHEEEEESLTVAPTIINGMVGVSSAASLAGRGEMSAMPSSQVHSSVCSAVPSASVSRKHSTVTKPGEVVGGVPILMEDDVTEDNQMAQMITTIGRSSSLCDQISGRPPLLAHRGLQSDSGLSHHPPLFQHTQHGASKDDASSNLSAQLTVCPGAITNVGALMDQTANLGASSQVDAKPLAACSAPSLDAPRSVSASADITKKLGAVTASSTMVDLAGPDSFSKSRPPAERSVSRLCDQTDGSRAVHSSVATPHTRPSDEPDAVHGRVEFVVGSGQEPESMAPIHSKTATSVASVQEISRSVTSLVDKITLSVGQSEQGPSATEQTAEELDEDDDKDDEEDDDNDDEEDEDEDEDKDHGEAADRFEPQTIHVTAPERAPNHPALFTHCQYLYVGAGRWQVYVQMWFVEERLKREAYVQVFDYEWHDYERVADLFEASRCLSPADRPSLLRLLALARHNCALIDGELQFPGPFSSRPSHFDAFELHEKLAVLRLHQQAREQLQREAEAQDSVAGAVIETATHDPSVSTSGVDTKLPGSVPTEKDTTIASVHPETSEVDGRTAATDELAACADHVAQLQEHQRESQQPVRALSPTRSAVLIPEADLSKDSIGIHTRSEVIGPALFVDVGALAPRNSYCALCDTHDYLHRVDLPAYLISPCYHCREALARDAKISPEVLLDLHLQHNIPWPAFLQARLNLPADGRSLEELIAYDCRWRSRQPCRCLVSLGGPLLPPCVEFPWLCPPALVTSWNGNAQHTTPTAVPCEEDASPTVTSTVPPAEPNFSREHSVSELKQRLADSKSGSPPQTMIGTHPADSAISIPPALHVNSSGRGTLPCATRHPRGAPTTCCHGIQFPRLGITSAHLPITQSSVVPPDAPQTVTTTTGTTTGHSSGGGAPPVVTNILTPNGAAF